MCDGCTGERSSYYYLYNCAYHLTSKNRELWIKDILKTSRSYCLAHRSQISKNIHKMHSQRILETVTESCRINAEKTANTDRNMVTHRTKRLVRSMLHHTYKPMTGRMFHRCVKEFSKKKNEENNG